MKPTHYLAWLLVASAGQAAAQAADQQGLMTFPHVRVERRPPAVAGGQGGFVAYKDPLTGALTSPTAEQAAALAAVLRAMQAPGLAGPMLTRPSYGGISLKLDDKQARYAVARKAGDGQLSQSCEPRLPALQGERQ